MEVLTLLVMGRSNKVIASELGITDQTVKNHTSSIYIKLGASCRSEAVAIAVRENLTKKENPSAGEPAGNQTTATGTQTVSVV